MADEFGPFDGVAFSEDNWSQLFRQVSDDGTFGGDTNLQVIPGTGLAIKVKAGRAFVQGFLYRNSDGADRSISIAANASGNPRIDRVVVRVVRSTNTATLAVLTGTPGVSPVAPALTQVDGGTWEISLAQVYVASGAASFISGNITDERNLLDSWRPFTPVWTGATTNPVIGNGTIEGYYAQRGKTVAGWMRILMGSTTTFGSGDYAFTLPVAPSAHYPADMPIGTVLLYDNNRAFRLLGVLMRTSGSSVSIETPPSIIMDSGTDTVVFPGGSAGSNTRTVNLVAGRFSSTPYIGIQTRVRITNIETLSLGSNSFQAIGRRTDDTNYSGSDTFDWVALQRLVGGAIDNIKPFDGWGNSDSIKVMFTYEAA